MYIAYDPTDHIIWGMSETERAAVEEAQKYIKDWVTGPKYIKAETGHGWFIDKSRTYPYCLIVRQATPELAKLVDELGSEVGFVIKNDIADVPDSQ